MSKVTKYRKPIITAQEARKCLGKASEGMTNDEIKVLNESMEQIARIVLRDHLVRNSLVVK